MEIIDQEFMEKILAENEQTFRAVQETINNYADNKQAKEMYAFDMILSDFFTVGKMRLENVSEKGENILN